MLIFMQKIESIRALRFLISSTEYLQRKRSSLEACFKGSV